MIRAFFRLPVLGCVAASAAFAFEFGWTRGASVPSQWTYALVAVALDLLKAGLPLMATEDSADRKHAKAAAEWFVFTWLTCLSLWCAYGVAAVQLAEHVSGKEVAAVTRQERQAALERIKEERSEIPAFTPTTAEAVEAQENLAKMAGDQAKAECEKRGQRCRDREADERSALGSLAALKANKALTESAAALDAKIATAEQALSKVDLKQATKEADPQVASMANAINVDRRLISFFSLAVLAIAIEMGSGLGVWFAFGHTPRRREKPAKATPQAAPAHETPTKARERFFADERRGKRLASSAVYLAYAKWCAENEVTPMSPQAFGRGGPWKKKEKTGGNVYYLDAAIKDGSVSTPALKIVASA
ncbi:MAG: hypothetical protein WBX25_31530 [Rhodomicrobium sp.]